MRARRERALGLSAQMLEISRARISFLSHSVRAVASASTRVLPMRGARAVAATYSELGLSVALSRRTMLMCPAEARAAMDATIPLRCPRARTTKQTKGSG